MLLSREAKRSLCCTEHQRAQPGTAAGAGQPGSRANSELGWSCGKHAVLPARLLFAHTVRNEIIQAKAPEKPFQVSNIQVVEMLLVKRAHFKNSSSLKTQPGLFCQDQALISSLFQGPTSARALSLHKPCALCWSPFPASSHLWAARSRRWCL